MSRAQKKCFALAGGMALAGTVLMAVPACSSTSTTPGADGGAGSFVDVVNGTSTSSSTSSTSSTGGDDGPPSCPDTTAIPNATIDAQWQWKAPNGIQTVCTGADLAAVSAAFKNTSNQTYDDVVKQISAPGNLPSGAPCLACITSKVGDANYGFLVQLADNTRSPPQFYTANTGGCFALETTPTCGQAITYLDYCAALACGGCTDNTSFKSCLGAKGVAAACVEEVKNFQSACNAYLADFPNQGSALNAACGDAIDGISSMCAGGTYDGGKLDGAP